MRLRGSPAHALTGLGFGGAQQDTARTGCKRLHLCDAQVVIALKLDPNVPAEGQQQVKHGMA
jgi:hypothetical protein